MKDALGPGWRPHAVFVMLGAALALPVLGLDLAFLGPSHGGWISLDFRGWLIGAYLAFWMSETVLSTLLVALGRARSAGVVIGAHLAAVALIVLAVIAVVLVVQRRDEAEAAEIDAQIAELTERAADQVRVVAWHRVGEGESLRPVLTFESSASGDLYVNGFGAPDLPNVSYTSNRVALTAGERREVTLEPGAERYDDDPPGEARLAASWTTGDLTVELTFCHPACLPDELGYRVVLELPPESAPAQ